MNLLRRRNNHLSFGPPVQNRTPKNVPVHGSDCPCQDDRSAGRWCETCALHGSHHTDRHDVFHANPWPERRHAVEFAPFTCAAPCGLTHNNYTVLTYAIGRDAAKTKATGRLLDPRRGHNPTTPPVATVATLDRDPDAAWPPALERRGTSRTRTSSGNGQTNAS